MSAGDHLSPKQFPMGHRVGKTAASSFDQCGPVSEAYTQHLRQHGHPDAHVVRLQGSTADPSTAHPKWQTVKPSSWVHYVTKVGGEYHDWTARQFDPKAKVPTVTKDTDAWQRRQAGP